jgi:hypothetical protein
MAAATATRGLGQVPLKNST